MKVPREYHMAVLLRRGICEPLSMARQGDNPEGYLAACPTARPRLKNQRGDLELTVKVSGDFEDPALLRWAYARTQNVYPTFRPTPKTSFLGALFAVGPILFWIAVFKADRDRKEKLIQEGKYERPFSVF
nr:PREDICTED: NADH dehydrogenase [ubiquinone] 1 beta subcomplex subunit 4 [Opisthocomus hoazin]